LSGGAVLAPPGGPTEIASRELAALSGVLGFRPTSRPRLLGEGINGRRLDDPFPTDLAGLEPAVLDDWLAEIICQSLDSHREAGPAHLLRALEIMRKSEGDPGQYMFYFSEIDLDKDLGPPTGSGP
jgi:hypothetical protein